MPKDNEKILAELELGSQGELPGFSADQMVRCEECLRANPPTRVSCLYCTTVLPVTEKTAALQKPSLRRLEPWEHGFNTILAEPPLRSLSSEAINEAASLLKLCTEELENILSSNKSLPLARAANESEATLIARRLGDLDLETLILPDERLCLDDMIRIRSASFDETTFKGYHVSGTESTELLWNDLVLLVSGRLLVRRVEVKERKSRRSENDIVHASEFFSDELVVDIYSRPTAQVLRIEAAHFDFSMLGERKGLVAGDNLRTLVELIRNNAENIAIDDSYNSLRQTLEPVWHSEQRNEAGGWHRERPGRYSTSRVTEISNENQFTRYSRLQNYLRSNQAKDL